MNEPMMTEAGKRLLDMIEAATAGVFDVDREFGPEIVDIEDEARAALLRELREEVKTLPTFIVPVRRTGQAHTYVNIESVFDMLEKPDIT